MIGAASDQPFVVDAHFDFARFCSLLSDECAYTRPKGIPPLLSTAHCCSLRRHSSKWMSENPLKPSLISCAVLRAGILLLGPSGSGKTYLLRNAAAQRTGDVNVFCISCADLINKVCGYLSTHSLQPES